MRIAYIDCIAGASGDMLLGCLIAAGVDQNELIKQLTSLGLTEATLRVTLAMSSIGKLLKSKLNLARCASNMECGTEIRSRKFPSMKTVSNGQRNIRLPGDQSMRQH